jgi:hypothetical protein
MTQSESKMNSKKKKRLDKYIVRECASKNHVSALIRDFLTL